MNLYYTVPRDEYRGEQATVLIQAWARLAGAAHEARRDHMPRTARDQAAVARRLVDAFGRRVERGRDGARMGR